MLLTSFIEDNLNKLNKDIFIHYSLNNTYPLFFEIHQKLTTIYFLFNPKNKYIYQKRHLEIFDPTTLLKELKQQINPFKKLQITSIKHNNFIQGNKHFLFVFLNEIFDKLNKTEYQNLDFKFSKKYNNFYFSFILELNPYKLKNIKNDHYINKLICLGKLYGIQLKILRKNKNQYLFINFKTKLLKSKFFIKKQNDDFVPVFKKKDISRDHFFHLRKQLIKLGCNPNQVIPVAKKLSMKVLGTSNEDNYKHYILNKTYKTIKNKISDGYKLFPLQNPDHPFYSHTDLFASIYGFELDYLRNNYISGKIADIGCGDGIFLYLVKKFLNIDGKGFDIQKHSIMHDINFQQISDIHEIDFFSPFIFLNHVLEHIHEEPVVFLQRLINHFNGLNINEKVQAIFFSLPNHYSVSPHLAANHVWVFHDNDFLETEKDEISKSNLKIYSIRENLNKILLKLGYKLILIPNIGVYIAERFKERKNIVESDKIKLLGDLGR